MTEQLSRAVASKWRRLMKYQADLLFPMELAFYHRRQEWHNASTVVDLGTGNGYYLCKLAGQFPLKRYTGIDLSGTNIKAATRYYRKNWEGPEKNVTFFVHNVNEFKGPYDLAIARLLVQHLTSLETFLERMQDVLSPTGSLFVIESCDSDRVFVPELPSFKMFFDALRANRIASGCNRDAGELL